MQLLAGRLNGLDDAVRQAFVQQVESGLPEGGAAEPSTLVRLVPGAADQYDPTLARRRQSRVPDGPGTDPCRPSAEPSPVVSSLRRSHGRQTVGTPHSGSAATADCSAVG